MPKLRFAQKIGKPPGHVAVARYGRWIFDVKRRLKDVRTLREALYSASLVASLNPDCGSVLVLDGPLLSPKRIKVEWDFFTLLIDGKLEKRIHIVQKSGDVELTEIRMPSGREIRTPLGDEFGKWREIVEQILLHENTPPTPSRPSAWSEILRVLMVHWVRRDGPVPSKQLVEETGFSYPTIASTLDEFSDYLVRGTNRSVGLRRFPLEPWQRLLASPDSLRHTRRYAVDGRPRPVESMLSRLRELNSPDIMVGGVPGARHWFPGLDLTGVPRLDLTVGEGMAWNRDGSKNPKSPEDGFISKLDPALRPALRHEPAIVVIHSLLTPATFSETSPEGAVWANEVECLLDLQEARLELQAQEFIKHLTPST